MSDMILVLRGAIDNFLYYRVELLRVLLIPFAILLVFELEVLPNTNDRALLRTVTFLYITVYAFALLSVFRILIIGPQAVPKWGVYKVSKSTVYFVLYIVCLFIVLYAISYFLYSFLPMPVNWLLFFIIKVSLLARISLVFPAISVGSYFSFTSSWRRTKNHQVLMLLVACAVVVLRELSKFMLSQFFLQPILFKLVIEITFWAFILALLSEAFKIIEMQNRGRLSHTQTRL